MQAIMLAAGKGSRLGAYTKDNTKCILEVNGKTLLERCIDALVSAGIDRLTLVLGYKKENVQEFIRSHELDRKLRIEYVYNDDYDTTNNIYSLYLARDIFSRDDTILLESDLIYEKEIIRDLIECEDRNVAVLARYEQWMDGTVSTLDEDQNILEFVEKNEFDFNNYDNYYKTLNIYKFSREYINRYYVPFLEAYIKAYGDNCYYELVLKVISGIQNSHLKGLITKRKWYEIDDCQDLDIAQLLFADEEDQLGLYQKRFGGYWRFENLKDYCYLVNPYFPGKKLLDKMKHSFDELISSYPSTLYIQNMCVSRFFGIREYHIIVGNGAAELINVMGHIMKGRIGVVIPAFNEYIRCFQNGEIIEIPCDEEYQLSKEILLSYLDRVDILAVVNPLNPTGSCLSEEDMLAVIEAYSKAGKYVICDESFIDFAEKDLRYTLITDEILEKYRKLIVVKSIGKSYGVGGLRLGVAASADHEILEAMKDTMPVWNINSFAEYFLEIFPIYKQEYQESCNKLAEERKRFSTELRKTGIFLRVFDSQANYVMCETKGITARELTMYLLKKDILIKDLTGKHGFEGREMVRIAVKSREDNDYLLEQIRKIGDLT